MMIFCQLELKSRVVTESKLQGMVAFCKWVGDHLVDIEFDGKLYNLWTKNIRAHSKIKKNILFIIFKLWKSNIWKIRYEDN